MLPPGRPRIRRRIVSLLAAVLLGLLSADVASGQAPTHADTASTLEKFARSVGATVFALAWPTAEYDSVTYGGIEPAADGGVSVTVVLHGRSAFNGGHLWTEAVLEVGRGEIRDLHWGRNNAILAEPGATVQALGAVLADLTREYREAQRADENAAPRARPAPAAMATRRTADRTDAAEHDSPAPDPGRSQRTPAESEGTAGAGDAGPLDRLIPGPWRALDERRREAWRAWLRGQAVGRRMSGGIERAQARSVAFYRDASLLELELDLSDGVRGAVSYVVIGDDVVHLNGTSNPIHELNRTVPVRLETADQVGEYLRFFVGAIQGEAGRFQLVSSADELNWTPDASEGLRRTVERRIVPLEVRADSAGSWFATGTVVYGRALFSTRFRVYGDGQVVMTDDEALASDLPVVGERFDEAGVRVLSG